MKGKKKTIGGLGAHKDFKAPQLRLAQKLNKTL